MAMIFFRFWSKLTEMKLFFSFETAKPVLFAYAIKNSELVKKAYLEKSFQLTLPGLCRWC